MPWKDVRPMDARMQFISRLLEGDRMVDLCQEYGISRKTGYKFLDRFKKEGALGLADRLKKPINIPHRTPEALERIVLKLRKTKPTWGPKKIKVKLEELHPGLIIPASSTIGDILKRNGCIEARRRRKKQNYFPSQLSQSTKPNEIWCVDFKGHFRLRNGNYCYPLTITDHYSRYLIACEAFEDTKTETVFPAFEEAFRRYGVPSVIRSDNGSPFASIGLGGLSRLSAWWIRIGIRPERIEPGHPEQNGRHERMHRTLKQETTRPPGKNSLQQQELFDKFRRGYNHERPHEALDMKYPADLYQPSVRVYREELPDPDYQTFDAMRKVSTNGSIWLPKVGVPCFLTKSLAGHPVGLRELEIDTWLVNYFGVDLGYAMRFGKYFALTSEKPFSPQEA
jgi:transposase InsO family protein